MINGVTLYPYQLDALRHMKNGCILCGGVGSGKSRTGLAYYYVLNEGKIAPSSNVPYTFMTDPPVNLYIITTARKRDTKEWDSELAPFQMSTDPSRTPYTNIVVVDSWNNIKKYELVQF